MEDGQLQSGQQVVYNSAMPKKSRKEKILSKQRILAKLSPDAKVKQEVRVEKETVPAVQDSESIRAASYFRHDLLKSLVLILAVITLEIIFYFASMSTVWGKLFKF